MIGVFDSGVGGLTLVKELLKVLPDYPIVYFGDTARTPYGNKSSATICHYARQDVEFLLTKGATMIVIGCNTASAEATDYLRQTFPDLPIFEVISPAVATALQNPQTKRLGVIGTRGTIASAVYQDKIKIARPEVEVLATPCPLFVPLVEEGRLNSRETKIIVRKYLQKLKVSNLDTLILGCTHYPLLAQVISAKIGKRVRLVDPALATAKLIADSIATLPVKPDGGLRHVYVSDLTPHVGAIAKLLLGRAVTLEQVNLD